MPAAVFVVLALVASLVGLLVYQRQARDVRTSAYSVRDDGAGFDQPHADKIFAPFRRLHSADQFPGTGVGLATAERIIHRHGGTLWARGAVDSRATFFFTLV